MILENERYYLNGPYNESSKAFGEGSTEPAIKWVKCSKIVEIKET